MELTKAQVISILELALANPNYLADRSENEKAVNWLCSSLHQVISDRYTCGQGHEIKDLICEQHIYPSINQYLFLRSYLVGTDAIAEGTCYTDEAFKIAARNHWQTLINKLKQEVEYEATLYTRNTL